ncbi:MAG: DUF1080 domain-containing protein [Gemmatimonadaceae bacterium]|nr:DUF1080 domain-containing protein [Gemmatimonadaceae bacterium]
MRQSTAAISFFALLSLTACMTTAKSGSAQAKRGEWRTMFDGKTASAWRGYKMDTMPSGWTVVDGTLGKAKSTVDIISRDEFSDFEFEMDWKLEKGGNSGLFYRGSEEFDRVYWSAPEYQLLDDANAPDGRNRLTSAGAAYGLYALPTGIVKAAGEWNSTRIVVKGAHVEHWLNGTKLEYELWSPDWEAKVQGSKFKAWAKYGRGHKGHIAIQGDHNGALTLRNMRVREW